MNKMSIFIYKLFCRKAIFEKRKKKNTWFYILVKYLKIGVTTTGLII